MIDHLALTTSSEHHNATVAFYLAFLQPLGYEKKLDMFDGKVVAFGTTGPEFFLSSAELSGSIQADTSAIHLAFRADDKATVDKSYAKGLEAGGIDNGKPGKRPQYGEGYYGAFLIDPSGNNAEVVHHGDAK